MCSKTLRRWKANALLLVCWLLPLACQQQDELQPQDPDGELADLTTYPLQSPRDLDVLIDAIGDARIVLLGEASHGTSEYYTWRTELSKRLIEEKGFDFIAVEGEWADSYRVNKFIQGPRRDSLEVLTLLETYNRWPTWMWGNYEVAGLVNWLNAYNQTAAETEKVGFYGLDVYCLWESMTELMPYLENAPPTVRESARRVHECFQPYSADPATYANAVATASADCRREVNQLWKAVEELVGEEIDTESELAMSQYALVALHGEQYYRTMVYSNNESWNIRDRHMAQTLDRLLDFYGADARAIVWEHNTHVGDARYTDMDEAGMVNVGELVRKEYGEEKVFSVGFGSYQGSVIAADAWGLPYEEMPVPAAQEGSWEYLLHQLSPENKIILSADMQDNKLLRRPIGHRAIGVVYDPQREHLGNYVPSEIPRRYDAFIFIDQTRALHPLGSPQLANEPPDLYPWGL